MRSAGHRSWQAPYAGLGRVSSGRGSALTDPALPLELPEQLKATIESLSGDQDQIAAGSDTGIFTYNVPDAAQMGALCSRLLSLTVGALFRSTDCIAGFTTPEPDPAVQSPKAGLRVQAETEVAPSTEVIAAVLPQELAEESSGLLASLAAYVQQVLSRALTSLQLLVACTCRCSSPQGPVLNALKLAWCRACTVIHTTARSQRRRPRLLTLKSSLGPCQMQGQPLPRCRRTGMCRSRLKGRRCVAARLTGQNQVHGKSHRCVNSPALVMLTPYLHACRRSAGLVRGRAPSLGAHSKPSRDRQPAANALSGACRCGMHDVLVSDVVCMRTRQAMLPALSLLNPCGEQHFRSVFDADCECETQMNV